MTDNELEQIIISGDSVYESKYKNIQATTINKEKNLLKLKLKEKATGYNYNIICIYEDNKLQIQDVWYKDSKGTVAYMPEKEQAILEEYLNKLIILFK